MALLSFFGNPSCFDGTLQLACIVGSGVRSAALASPVIQKAAAKGTLTSYCVKRTNFLKGQHFSIRSPFFIGLL